MKNKGEEKTRQLRKYEKKGSSGKQNCMCPLSKNKNKPTNKQNQNETKQKNQQLTDEDLIKSRAAKC